MFIHIVVKPARYFINRLLDTLHNMNGSKTRMAESIKKDIVFCYLSSISMVPLPICMKICIALMS